MTGRSRSQPASVTRSDTRLLADTSGQEDDRWTRHASRGPTTAEPGRPDVAGARDASTVHSAQDRRPAIPVARPPLLVSSTRRPRRSRSADVLATANSARPVIRNPHGIAPTQVTGGQRVRPRGPGRPVPRHRAPARRGLRVAWLTVTALAGMVVGATLTSQNDSTDVATPDNPGVGRSAEPREPWWLRPDAPLGPSPTLTIAAPDGSQPAIVEAVANINAAPPRPIPVGALSVADSAQPEPTEAEPVVLPAAPGSTEPQNAPVQVEAAAHSSLTVDQAPDIEPTIGASDVAAPTPVGAPPPTPIRAPAPAPTPALTPAPSATPPSMTPPPTAAPTPTPDPPQEIQPGRNEGKADDHRPDFANGGHGRPDDHRPDPTGGGRGASDDHSDRP